MKNINLQLEWQDENLSILDWMGYQFYNGETKSIPQDDVDTLGIDTGLLSLLAHDGKLTIKVDGDEKKFSSPDFVRGLEK